MNTKISTSRFFLAIFVFFLLPIFPSHAGVLDFYSEIDDKGESLAENLVTRQLADYGTFRNFGKRCRGEMSWLDTEPVNERTLKQIQRGEYTDIMEIARKKKIPLTSSELNGLVSCLRESYTEMQLDARTQQSAIDTAGSIGLYNDGDIKNSDFDIIDDINKINAIIFREDLVYKGKVNPTSKALTDFLRGRSPEKLFTKNSDSNHVENGNSQENGNPSG